MDRNKAEFIHIWVRQLLREHKLICRRYGLKLTRPVIEVVDVSSYWGKWLAETTTISLSQTLLYSQTWDAVLNVLKHEMGHQLVAEVLDGAPGHGADFKRACEILGVPAQFRRASSTIAGAVPGEPDHRPTEAERILKKIRKLLALSDSTNEHEALLAMQKARQLLDIYNLDEELNQSKSEYTYTNLLINLRRKRVECYHRAICSLLIEYFHAEIVITPLYDAHDLTTYKCIDIMGKNSNVKIAGYVYHFLMDRLPALWRQHQTAKLRPKNGRNSYWLGVLNGFREGLANDLQAEEKATETANLPPATTANLPPATTANLPATYRPLPTTRPWPYLSPVAIQNCKTAANAPPGSIYAISRPAVKTGVCCNFARAWTVTGTSKNCWRQPRLWGKKTEVRQAGMKSSLAGETPVFEDPEVPRRTAADPRMLFITFSSEINSWQQIFITSAIRQDKTIREVA